jgi:glycosyltransferase involved in cell wall biosynthesis
MSLCAVVLTKNREKDLPELFGSLGFADEVLVVDDYSTDETVKVAKKLGARVVKRRLDDFASQRNFALEQTQADWVLFIDADERVSKELAEEITRVVADDDEEKKAAAAYRIPRANKIFGRVMRHSGWAPDERIVLFRRGRGRFVGAVHERPEIDGKVGRLTRSIAHDNYQDLDQFLDKARWYSKLAAQDLVDSGYRFKWQDLLGAPVEEFLRRFLAWEGYRDGLHGLALSLLQAFVTFQVYLRVWQRGGFVESKTDLADVDGLLIEKASAWKWWVRKIISGRGRWARWKKKVIKAGGG